jgi:hypothetical protein
LSAEILNGDVNQVKHDFPFWLIELSPPNSHGSLIGDIQLRVQVFEVHLVFSLSP